MPSLNTGITDERRQKVNQATKPPPHSKEVRMLTIRGATGSFIDRRQRVENEAAEKKQRSPQMVNCQEKVCANKLTFGFRSLQYALDFVRSVPSFPNDKPVKEA